MKYKAEKVVGKKAYIQLYDQLKTDITGGVYPYGTRLPSKRLLAEETGVSVITAEHAFALLCDEGYAQARERSGYFVIYKDSDFLFSPGSTPPAVKKPRGHINYPDSSLSYPLLAKTMRKVLADKGEALLVKSPNHGCPELREELVRYLARSQGMRVTPEQIIIGSGAEYLYSLTAQLFSDRLFALEDPSYEKIRRVYQTCGISFDLLPLDTDGIRSEALNATRATVLHVTPFNSYPSGVTAPASKRAEYLRFADRRDGYIIEDNYDSELTVSAKNDTTLFSLSDGGRVIYMNTFSKTVAPSLRAGYMVLPKRLCPLFEQKLGFYSCTVPVFEQYVLAELIDSGEFERHINRVRRAKRAKGG